MTLDILRKYGGWCVELQQPLKYQNRDVTEIEIRKPTADQMIRWGGWKIPSVLAFLSELCGLPEKLLRQLPQDEFDRVMFAFFNVAPIVKAAVDANERPIATPDEDLPTDQAVVPDQQDPRFPAAVGPVVRLREHRPEPPSPSPPPPAEDVPAMNFNPPQTTEVVR